jgi:hypothetical protein
LKEIAEEELDDNEQMTDEEKQECRLDQLDDADKGEYHAKPTQIN